MFSLPETDLNYFSEVDNNYKNLSFAVEQSPVSIVITDIKGNIEYINPKFTELTGYSLQEIKGKNPKILGSGEKSKTIYKDLWETILSGKEWRGEFYNKKKNGEYFWEYALILPIKNPDGKLTHFIGIKENITEKKAAYKALEESEFKYRELIENSSDGIFITDEHANIKLVNTKALCLIGYSAEELLSMNFQQTYIENDKYKFVENLEKLMTNGIVSYERHVKRKDNSAFPAEVNVRKIKNNGYQVTLRDITERKKHEEKILLQASMLDQVGQAIMAVDTNGSIIYFNKAAELLFDCNEAEVSNKTVLNVLPAIDRKEVDNIINVISKGGSWGKEILINKRNNNQIPIFLTITPVFDSDTKPIGAIGISFDLSEQKRKEKEILEAKEKAEEMNRLKSSFLANMSHELRTPMVGILGFSEILLDEIKEVRHKEMLKSIFNSGQRLLNTLNLILDLSRVESNKTEIIYSRFDLQRQISEIVDLFKGAASIKNLSLNFESSYFNFYIYSDDKIVHNILSNLLHNALKFTMQGYVKINLYTEFISDEEYAVICVSDTGIGIPEEHQDDIFDEFRQISEGFNRSFEGTGLGLTLAKKFISLLGGFITLKSIPGIGSKFFLYLPSNSDSKNESGKNLLEKKEDFNSRLPKILLVENDNITIALTKKYLKNLCNIDSAQNAEATLELVNKNSYDLILMDIHLGNSINGIELTKLLRNNTYYKSIPIVAFTAYALDYEKEEFISAGCNDFLSKPFTKSDLQTKIKENLKNISNSN